MMRGHGRPYAGSHTCDGRGPSCLALLGDCVCNIRDAVSFGVGIASVVCWGVAEVPQIITSFREGSTEGISVFFLMTWVVGDVFNLVGCYIEPSTLPTQLYTALLYTITTLILLGQVIYYKYILPSQKGRRVTPAPPIMQQDEAKEVYKPIERIETKPVLPQASSQPIAYGSPASSGPVRERYYMSARSLASSHTPTAGSYLAAGSRGASGGRTSSNNYLLLHNSSVEDFQGSHPIPISINTSRSAPAPINNGSSPSMLRAVVSIAMCVGGLNIGRGLMMKHNSETLLHAPGNVARVFSGRKLFQTRIFSSTLHQESEMSGSVGVWFGWIMAAIYMGGRLPQIWLNIKRGSVEGLNPLMFTFALVGNVTYVGSILIRSAKWKNIKSNMPWIVDAAVCVVLDCFILCQFIYYLTRKQKDDTSDDSGGHYKPLE